MSPRRWNEFPLPLCDHPPPDVTDPPPLRVPYPLDFSISYIYIYFFDLLATPFVKTLILHGTRLLNDQPIVQQLYYIVSRVVLASPLREEEEEEEVFSSSHVSLRQKPRFCSPPPPSPTVVGHVNHILPSSFHLLLRDLTIRLCTHARLRERQLTHAANHRVLSSPPRVSLFLFLDPLVAVCIERRRE